MALLNCARRFRDELFRKRKARAPCLEFLRVTSSYQEGGKERSEKLREDRRDGNTRRRA